MKKSLIILLVAALLAITAALPAFAAGGRSTRGGSFMLSGNIAAIDNGVVTVAVVAGNPASQPYIGQTLEIQTTDSTLVMLRSDAGAVAGSLTDLAVGQTASVRGQLVDGIWTASRITVGANLLH